MSSEHTFEDKGKVKPKPAQETAEPAKDDGSLTSADLDGKLDASTLTQMQQTVGNAAVQRFLAQRQGSGPAEIQEETANTINSKRGSGSALDSGMAEKAGEAMGQDFSGVNVHTDNEADELSRGLGAKAFTTGSDIFFQSGEYNPGSSEGQQLLAHELTHVVQQGGSGPSGGKMTVNDPNDQYEEEADNVADQIMNMPDPALQRQTEGEEEEEAPLHTKVDPALQRQEEEEAMPKLDPALQRQEEEEPEQPAALKPDPALQRQDEDELHLKPVQRQEEEEAMPKLDPSLQRQDEDELQTKPVQRQEEEEAMPKLDPSLQRQEEEEAMPKLDPALQRQEEEEAMPKLDPALQRQEEEEAMPKLDPALQRQEEEEAMPKLDPALQRQEEEEAMPKLDPALQRQEQNEEDIPA
jgi:hypothetical protein